MTNKQILKKLESTEGRENAKAVKELLPQWNLKESFPDDHNSMMRYIRMHQWDYEDFGFGMEMILTRVFQRYILRSYFDMKEFRSNHRNVLTSTCIALSKMEGLLMNTQDEKAYCLYHYSLNKYYGHN